MCSELSRLRLPQFQRSCIIAPVYVNFLRFSAPSMLISHGQDEIIPYAAANKTAHAWCGFGAPITFVTDTGGPGHAGGYLNWNTLAIPWLNDRINGVPLPTKGCSFTSVKMGGLWFKRDDKSMII